MARCPGPRCEALVRSSPACKTDMAGVARGAGFRSLEASDLGRVASERAALPDLDHEQPKVERVGVDERFGRRCFGISAEGIGTIGCLLNFIVTCTVSRLTAPPPARVLQLVESIRIPAGSLDP